MRKVCACCGRTRSYSSFYKNSSAKDGLQYSCKECNQKRRDTVWVKADVVQKFSWSVWACINKRTVNGYNPKPHVKEHASYFSKGIEIRVSREEFREFCENNRDLILEIYASGDLPSVDRIDGDGHYVIGNMQIIPRKQNSGKGKGVYRNRFGKPVRSLDLKTGHEKAYRCIRDAVRDGFHKAHIAECCNGKARSHAGKRWSWDR